MKPRILKWLAISVVLILVSCTGEDRVIPQTRCKRAIAIATQTWEVDYYISKTSGGMNTQRTHAFQSNTLTNFNGEKPVDAVSGPDDNGVWWAALPPRPTADEVDQNRETQERNDPPLLERSIDYQLDCETGTLLTNALTYREAARSIRSGQAVSVTYLGNQALKIEKNDGQ
ncbi:MAG: hypothetical protein HC936_00100 [Leptolyngbyaceae cyanobacterium SU_3_3]|nr:hypothetical protein [Leptolyngbyaceae cyanobacterium SU_3_3]NJR48687.1 hypothetical protein [Leptolyngbyaceae cyanobacterium CSU_1_3]